MNRTRLALIGICLLFPALSFAQLKQDTKLNVAKSLVQPQPQGLLSLIGLDPSKFSMHHSYSFTVGSIGGETYNQGLYLNTMRYRFADPLSMYLQVGFQHQPFANQASRFNQGNNVFVSGAGVQYEPSDNFKVQLEFSQRPVGLYASPYYQSPGDKWYLDHSLFEKTDREEKQEN